MSVSEYAQRLHKYNHEASSDPSATPSHVDNVSLIATLKRANLLPL